MNNAYTYILECANGQYYVGSTTDLERRLQEHQAGLGANFTKKHLPVKLVYYEEYQSVEQAFYRERQLHGWSRAKKEALIKGEFEKLPELSTSKQSPSTLRHPSTPLDKLGDRSGTAQGPVVDDTVAEPVAASEPTEEQ